MDHPLRHTSRSAASNLHEKNLAAQSVIPDIAVSPF
jgi:hypothetical protein